MSIPQYSKARSTLSLKKAHDIRYYINGAIRRGWDEWRYPTKKAVVGSI